MRNNIDDFQDFAEFDAVSPTERPDLTRWQWSFADLPSARMKTVAAGWMVRVLLGADPAVMSEEEMRILCAGAAKKQSKAASALGCDA